MQISPKLTQRWWVLLPILIAGAMPIWELQVEYGWLDMGAGQHARLFWFAVVAWLVLTFAAIKRYRAWWLLITAPFVLYPVVMMFGLLAACAHGDCL